jgi:hypothetical protein
MNFLDATSASPRPLDIVVAIAGRMLDLPSLPNLGLYHPDMTIAAPAGVEPAMFGEMSLEDVKDFPVRQPQPMPTAPRNCDGGDRTRRP